MADTNFVDKVTVIATSWLQVVNYHVYKVGTIVKHYSKEISWTQTGGSAVARTVEKKLYEFVSVKDFGAVGDGVADDTPAIQAAIDSLLPSGGTVHYFDKHLVNANLIIKSNVTLKVETLTQSKYAKMMNFSF